MWDAFPRPTNVEKIMPDPCISSICVPGVANLKSETALGIVEKPFAVHLIKR
jgi:hypothetical protein